MKKARKFVIEVAVEILALWSLLHYISKEKNETLKRNAIYWVLITCGKLLLTVLLTTVVIWKLMVLTGTFSFDFSGILVEPSGAILIQPVQMALLIVEMVSGLTMAAYLIVDWAIGKEPYKP